MIFNDEDEFLVLMPYSTVLYSEFGPGLSRLTRTADEHEYPIVWEFEDDYIHPHYQNPNNGTCLMTEDSFCHVRIFLRLLAPTLATY